MRQAHADAPDANWIERISFCPMRFKSNMRGRSGKIGSGRPLILNVKEGIQDCKLIQSVKRLIRECKPWLTVRPWPGQEIGAIWQIAPCGCFRSHVGHTDQVMSLSVVTRHSCSRHIW